ncbi:venom protease-like isoform X2 [Daktulosphaira vitifoliae]|uniref:venom protease-like isoform X2 n=1 Tax=Daktulosphaira vitifoliae TaxID=58002 RepID=UPI0021A9EB7D|nr:venom protease-like isoform X2 [Daktulosphaira vitifoliae]
MAKTLYFIILFVLTYVIAQSRNKNTCLNAYGEDGICINIKNCPSMLSILENDVKNEDGNKNNSAADFLRKSMCGNEGKDPKVCCSIKPTTFNSRKKNDSLSSQSSDSTYSNLPLPDTCGINNVTTTKIIGGSPAELGYHRINQPRTDTPEWNCGGTLISDRYVVTATHCIVTYRVLTTARLGDLDLNPEVDDGAEPIDIPIQKIITHQSYSKITHANDIALLKLDRPVLFNKHVQPICLPISPTMRANTFLKYEPLVIGWGMIAVEGPMTRTTELMQVNVPVVDNENCNRSYTGIRAIIDDSIICAGTGKADSCKGDSGGPLMWPKGKQHYLLGIVSTGFKCAESGFPGLYTRVSHYIEWITENMNKN